MLFWIFRSAHLPQFSFLKTYGGKIDQISRLVSFFQDLLIGETKKQNKEHDLKKKTKCCIIDLNVPGTCSMWQVD